MRSIARNTATIFIGQAMPLAVGLCAIPALVHLIGTDRLGVMSLVWVTVGYFSVLDLGIGRAVTNTVAEAIGSNQTSRVPETFWTAVTCQILMGGVATVSLLLGAPFLVTKFLSVPPSLHAEVLRAFAICSMALPIVFTSSTAVGMLEAAGRFDLSAAVQSPTAVLQYLFPLVFACFTKELGTIVGTIIVARTVSLIVLMVLCAKVYPGLLTKVQVSLSSSKNLLQYGGWITISNVVSPLLVYSDRFLVGSLLGLSAVAYYSVPLDTSMRMLVIPGSLATVLFPYFSRIGERCDSDQAAEVVRGAVRFVLLTMGVLSLCVYLESNTILGLWMGRSFAQESADILKILAIGILGNSLARIPYSLLQGSGFVKQIAVLHVCELAVQVPAMFLAVRTTGLRGAALVWSVRTVSEAIILFYLAFKLTGLKLKWALPRNGYRFALCLVALAAVGNSLRSLLPTCSSQIAVSGASLLAALLLGYLALIEESDICRGKYFLKRLLSLARFNR